jgi:ParB-like chromosome segregation protein Spo0J
MPRAKAPQRKVETVPLEALRPDPENARVHGRDNLAAIRASLERFGQVRPLLATSDGLVVAGNGTLAAMRSLGWTEAKVLRLPWDDAATCRPNAIADTRTAERARWDDETLAGQLGELTAAGLPMEALGFTPLPQGAGSSQGSAATAEAERSYRCPACGFRWRSGEGGEVVAL